MRFAKDVLSVISVLRPRNPFLPHNGPDLVMLHTREVVPSAIAQTLCNAYNRGKDLHDVFVSDRLRNGRVAITDTIKRSALQAFARRTDDTKNRSKVIALRKDISLVSTLFLSLQSRPDFDLNNFFKYENQRETPSLSDQRKLRSGTKSDVLQCLTIPKLTPPDDVTVKVLWFTWFAQPTGLTTSNMLCVTTCHSLPTLSQIRHRDSTSFGTSTLITTSKPRLRQNEATPAWQPSSKALHLYLVTGTSF